jgi:hypothetical protein
MIGNRDPPRRLYRIWFDSGEAELFYDAIGPQGLVALSPLNATTDPLHNLGTGSRILDYQKDPEKGTWSVGAFDRRFFLDSETVMGIRRVSHSLCMTRSNDNVVLLRGLHQAHGTSLIAYGQTRKSNTRSLNSSGFSQ